jgi:hypothetical protein
VVGLTSTRRNTGEGVIFKNKYSIASWILFKLISIADTLLLLVTEYWIQSGLGA